MGIQVHKERCAYINVIGGLGNQMFQHAFGRALSLRHGTSLKLVTDMFATYKRHQGFELQRAFALTTPVASQRELSQVLRWRAKPAIRKLAAKIRRPPLTSPAFVAEPSFRFTELSWNTAQSVYLQGYWQSPRYFSDYANEIRADFTFAKPLSGLNLEIAARLSQCVSVSVHVRRGDYVGRSWSQSIYAACTPAYYSRAIEVILSKHPGASLFVFSDDPEWVMRELRNRVPQVTIVDHNRGPDSYTDMRLMSLCKHHIIANSTFSWWGAWLGYSVNQTVIAPRHWFASGQDDEDLLPSSWIRL